MLTCTLDKDGENILARAILLVEEPEEWILEDAIPNLMQVNVIEDKSMFGLEGIG